MSRVNQYRSRCDTPQPQEDEEDLFANFSSVCVGSNNLWSKRCSWNMEQELVATKTLRINLQQVQTMPRKSRISINPPVHLQPRPESMVFRDEPQVPFKFPNYQDAKQVDHRHSQTIQFPPTPPSIVDLPSPPTVLTGPIDNAFSPVNSPKRSSWVPKSRGSYESEFFTFEEPQNQSHVPPSRAKRDSSFLPAPPAPLRNRIPQSFRCRALSPVNTNTLTVKSSSSRQTSPTSYVPQSLPREAQTYCPGDKVSRRMSVRMRVRPLNENFAVPLLTVDSEPEDYPDRWLNEVSRAIPSAPCLKQMRRPVKTTLTSTKNSPFVKVNSPK